MCGENSRWSAWATPARGSSPRVRGKLPRESDSTARNRLIPACAGKTRTCGGVPGRKRAHPRVCGENLQVIAHRVELAGSSPRVRGKLPYAGNYSFCPGLIPACAGKTRNLSPRSVHLAAHPRVCGENVGVVRDEIARQGSSPRVRGKHDRIERRARNGGLIPACAGKTQATHLRGLSSAAHPRVCGENVYSSTLPVGGSGLIPACAGKTSKAAPPTNSPNGSSPRVRGKPGRRVVCAPRTGLIPACAGKTVFGPCCPTYMGAHPRVCGENDATNTAGNIHTGSSPRVRGKRQSEAGITCGPRLIPACAGKTATRRRFRRAVRAHPRVCGENMYCSTSGQSMVGSSPRVRGKLPSTRRYQATGGLIPACAGKTDDDTGESDTDWAHPRVCGENADKLVPALGEYGSSPRVRGKRGLRTWSFALLRLIPACAGKTRRGRPR